MCYPWQCPAVNKNKMLKLISMLSHFRHPAAVLHNKRRGSTTPNYAVKAYVHVSVQRYVPVPVHNLIHTL